MRVLAFRLPFYRIYHSYCFQALTFKKKTATFLRDKKAPNKPNLTAVNIYWITLYDTFMYRNLVMYITRLDGIILSILF
jgi:hypothetical protein